MPGAVVPLPVSEQVVPEDRGALKDDKEQQLLVAEQRAFVEIRQARHTRSPQQLSQRLPFGATLLHPHLGTPSLPLLPRHSSTTQTERLRDSSLDWNQQTSSIQMWK